MVLKTLVSNSMGKVFRAENIPSGMFEFYICKKQEFKDGTASYDIGVSPTDNTDRGFVFDKVRGTLQDAEARLVEILADPKYKDKGTTKTKEERSAVDVLSSLNSQQKDEVYRALWAEHVEEDVRSQMEGSDEESELSDEEYDALVKTIAHRYAYNGDYNCELSYWDNIDALIEDELDKLESEHER